MRHGERSFTLASVRDISERKATPRRSSTRRSTTVSPALPTARCSASTSPRALASAKRTQRAPRGAGDGPRRVQAGQRHARARPRRHPARQVGERLVGALREGDTVARLGGDEFGDPAGGRHRPVGGGGGGAGRSSRPASRRSSINDEVVHVSPSIGIALFPEHGDTTAELLHRADLAMYAAKRSGRRPRRLRRRAGDADGASPGAAGRSASVRRPRRAGPPLSAQDRSRRPARSPASRRWSAGSTPRRACSRRRASCPRSSAPT